MSETTLEQVSAEHDGRVLTGVGTTSDALQETMERRASDVPLLPSEASAEAAQPAPSSSGDRDAKGQFVKPTRGQKRFDQLTGEREAERRAREAAERERDTLKAELEAARRPVEPPKAPPAEEPATPAKFGQTFEQYLQAHPSAEYEDYIDERARFIAREEAKTLDIDARVEQRLEAARASRSFEEQVVRVRTEALKVYPDFEQVITTGPGANISLGPTPQQADARIKLILGLPEAATIEYAIAKDGDLAQRLARMSDVEFGITIARLAPGTGVASPASTLSREVRPVPAPYQPVGSGSVTTSPPSSELTKRAGFDFDKSGYREKRAEERGVRRR